MLAACFPDTRDVSADYAVVGIDVSRYQGVIDWRRVARDGHDFAFIKSTEGRELRDPRFTRNWEEARRVGLRRGAYHFFRPEVPAPQQAINFFRHTELLPGDLPPVLDVEERGNLSPTQLVKAVRKWAEMAEDHYGVKPIIYSGQHFYNRFLAGQLTEYPLWLARYDVQAPVTVSGRSYQFWQYTDAARVPGIRGRVDRNVFLGSHLDLALLCIPPPPSESERVARR